MRRKRKSVGTLFFLALAASTWVAFAAQDAGALPRDGGGPFGDPVIAGDSADPDALGNEAPALPPTDPGVQTDPTVEIAAVSGTDSLFQRWMLELQTIGVLRLLMRM